MTHQRLSLALHHLMNLAFLSDDADQDDGFQAKALLNLFMCVPLAYIAWQLLFSP